MSVCQSYMEYFFWPSLTKKGFGSEQVERSLVIRILWTEKWERGKEMGAQIFMYTWKGNQSIPKIPITPDYLNDSQFD